jgi:TIR domain
MALFTSEYLKSKSSLTSINESKKIFSSVDTSKLAFDIFLSHSFLDKEEVFGLYRELTSMGYTVYVDWIVDSHLDRTNITKDSAELIRIRLKNSKSLLLAISTNSTMSKWIPWELGFVDGNTNRCAVVPVSKDNAELHRFNRVEYLSLYPYLDRTTFKNSKEYKIWVNEDIDRYVEFESWMKGSKPTTRK